MIVSIASPFQEISKAEKRKLAEFPQLTLSADFWNTFPQQFGKYVDDHFGFRSEIVQFHNYILCKIFKISPSRAVVIGSDNWYFYDGDRAIYDYLGKIKHTDRQLLKTSRLLEERKTWLDSLGIEYLFLPIPNKEPIYEEHLPYKIRINRGKSKYEQIIEYTKEHSTFRNFIDVQQLMLNHKTEQPLYLKTDSHWNYNGAYLVYREIIKRLQQKFPDLKPLEQNKEKTWITNFSGDLANIMNLYGLVRETAPGMNIKHSCNTKKIEPLSSIRALPVYKDLHNDKIPVIGGCAKKKYKVLFIHDSFGSFLHPYFSEQFETVIYVNGFNFEQAKALIESERPDIVIDERVGRNLEKALRPDPELKQLLSTSSAHIML